MLSDFKCEQCGNVFQSKQVKSRFCTNACKSRWRRENKIDNILKKCLVCKKEFTSNKYSKTLTCGRACGVKLSYANGATHSETHGMSNQRIYSIWRQMKQRCYNPKATKYSEWGGRGITVCDEWHTFKPFYDWAMANGYAEILSIDRIENDGSYEPSNCRWVTKFVQSRNQRKSKNNTSGVVGVHWSKNDNAWVASIKADNKYIFLGNHKTLEDAKEARKKGELKHWINN